MIDIRVAHALGAGEASTRLTAAFAKRSVAVVSADGGRSGTLTKQLPFVGSVSAEFEVQDDAVLVRVTQAPAFPSADTLRRMVEDELAQILKS